MASILQNNINNSSAHRASRAQNAEFILKNVDLFPDFIEIVFKTDDKNNFKACWILELVLEQDLNLLFPHLNQFCDHLKTYTNHSAIRSIAKICMFLAKNHIRNEKLNSPILSERQVQKITEKCLDWLIDDNEKVATKAYAIRTLYALGKNIKWIYPELRRILSEDYTKHSPAYKAVAREILKKLK